MVSNKTYLSDVENVLQLKQLISIGDPNITKEYKKILKKADALLSYELFSVTQKTQVPPSGDKKDYLSLGPYWWPDPNKPDGLPWIRKDGKVNPKTRQSNTDITIKNYFFKTFKTVAWAAILSEEGKFVKKSEQLLQTWFTDTLTGMNPNLNYAQGIPGRNNGRGYGIIEFAGFSDILMYVELLNHFKLLDQKLVTAFTNWTKAYSTWLQENELGIFEQNRENNHGTWYDVQLVSILLFLDEIDEAKKILEAVKTNRIAVQIKPDGTQPHELKRTKALSYSTMNLKAFTKLAYFGKKTNVDLWNYRSEYGASIPKAYNFLLPYAKNKKKWNYEQIKDLEKVKKSLQLLIKTSGCLFSVSEYQELPLKINTIDSIINSCR